MSSKNIWITITHIAASGNVEADTLVPLSWMIRQNGSLTTDIFQALLKQYVEPHTWPLRIPTKIVRGTTRTCIIDCQTTGLGPTMPLVLTGVPENLAMLFPLLVCWERPWQKIERDNADMTASTGREDSEPTLRQGQTAPAGTQAPSDGVSLIRQSLQARRVSQRAQEIILRGWRQSTKKQYVVHLDRWKRFCDGRVCNPIYTTVGVVLDFLTNLFEAAHSYSSINTARSALSTVVILQDETTTVGKHPLICKFMKGVFHERPALPRYQATWDVQIVLNRLKKWAPVRKLSLKELTLKLIMLLALVSGQRCQTLHALSLDNMSVGKSSYKFHVTTLVKQSAPGRAQPIVILPAFPADRRLCIYIQFWKSI